MFGKLNQEWVGVPAGTELEILETNIAFGDRVHYCRRVDGKPLPGAWGYRTTGRIAANFVDLV